MKKTKTIIMVLLFFMGLLVLLYPTLSDFYNQKVQSAAIVDYESILKDYEEKDYSKFFDEANKYNQELRELSSPYLMFKDLKKYKNIMNLDGTGMMGYISIDKIKLELPIYHGTSEEVLSVAVGHLEGSSFPVGGIGTHSVLSAHRGLPSTKLFTDLDKLEIGDTFSVTVLNKQLTYQVDHIEIVLPHEIDNLKIDSNKDYLTLMTCTPYGINTHRLLVRGVRIEGLEKTIYITTEAFRVNVITVTSLVALPIIFMLLIFIIFKPVDSNNKDIIMKKYLFPSKIKWVGGIKNESKNK